MCATVHVSFFVLLKGNPVLRLYNHDVSTKEIPPPLIYAHGTYSKPLISDIDTILILDAFFKYITAMYFMT